MKLMHVGLQGLGLLARKGLLAVSFLLIARKLGPAEYGQLSYLYTWTYIFFVLSGLGFSAVSTRELAKPGSESGTVLRASLFVRMLSAGLGTGLFSLLVAIPGLLGKGASLAAGLIYAWLIPAYAILDQLGAYFVAFENNAAFATINVVQWSSFLIATYFALAHSHSLHTLVAWQTIGMWAGLVFACVLLPRPLLSAWRARNSSAVARFLLREAVPLGITNILGVLYFRVGTLYLFRYSGAEQTGIFTSASQILEASQIIPMALVGASFPMICRAAQDPSSLSLVFERVTSSLIFVALFVATTGTIVSSAVLRLLYGQSYDAGGLLLRILIWTVVPTFLHYALAFFLIAIRKQQFVPISALVGVVVSLTSNFLLVPRFGALGAVYSSGATEISICALHLFFVLKYIAVRPQFRLLSLAAAGGMLVWGIGIVWQHQINATMPNVFSFSALSCALFGMTFALYRRLGNRMEIA